MGEASWRVRTVEVGKSVEICKGTGRRSRDTRPRLVIKSKKIRTIVEMV